MENLHIIPLFPSKYVRLAAVVMQEACNIEMLPRFPRIAYSRKEDFGLNFPAAMANT